MDMVLNARTRPLTAADTEDAKPWKTQAKPALALILECGTDVLSIFEYVDFRGAKMLGASNLRLYFTHVTVCLTGRCLRTLADHLQRHTVTCIRERHAAFFLPGEEGYIERIEFAPPDPEALARRPMAFDLPA